MIVLATKVSSILKPTRINVETVIVDAQTRLVRTASLIQIHLWVNERILVVSQFGCWNTSVSLDVEDSIL